MMNVITKIWFNKDMTAAVELSKVTGFKYYSKEKSSNAFYSTLNVMADGSLDLYGEDADDLFPYLKKEFENRTR